MYLLFIENWDSIKNNKLIPIKQNEDIMTKHLLKDRPNLNIILPYGWNTHVKIAKYLYDNDDKINFVINNRIINNNNPTYFIAELSCNHNQDKSICFKLIDEAHKAGANAIKLQTYTPDTMTLNCDKSIFKDCLNGSIWEGTTLYDLYSKAYNPWNGTKN